MNRQGTRKLVFVALVAAINILGGMLAFGFKLPIYLDMIGTLFVAVTLGPVYAMATAAISALINGMYDVYAIYFMPVALLGGLIAGRIYRRRPSHWTARTPLDALTFTAPSTILASMIAAYLFGGQTSSGSSLIAQFLNKVGLNLVSSVFLVQIVTDYADRLISLVIVFVLVEKIPSAMLDLSHHE